MIIKDNKLYDRAKWVAQIFLPALGTLIFGLGGVWDWAYTGQVVGTITAVDAFLGLLLQRSNKQFNQNPDNFDGELIIAEGSGVYPEINAALNEHPDTFGDTVTFKTKRVDLEPKDPFRGR